MEFIHFGKLVPVVILLLVARRADAQGSIYNPAMVWKKEVTREIEVRVSKEPGQPTGSRKDSSLAEMIISDVVNGKLKAKASTANDLANDLTADDVKSVLADVRKNDPNYDSVYRYRLYETWVFNPTACATDISIWGIVPLKSVYTNGVRSSQPIFGLRYVEVKDILQRYHARHPGSSFYNYAWNDYFSTKARTQGTQFKNTVVRTIDFADKEDNAAHHFTDMGSASNFLDIIDSEIANGIITIYDTMGNTVKKRDIPQAGAGAPGQMTTKSREGHPIAFPRYMRVVEFWTFNTTNGDIHVHNIHVQMLNSLSPRPAANNEKAADEPSWFGAWLRYGDVREIIADYEQTHPAINFATRVWNNYFYSDVKPVVVK